MTFPESSSVTSDVALLDRLDPASREVAVTSMLDQARQWLERAKESTVPAQDVAEFKAFVATVAEAAKQKKLSEEIQLDAVEMVRRSERALGMAIRDGQSAGEIRGRGSDTRVDLDDQGLRGDLGLTSPTEFASMASLKKTIYPVTDNVSDVQFEEALASAKEEGNLSNANVVRKVTELGSFREQQVDKWALVAEYSQQGYTSHQIAREVGMSEEGLRAGAKKKAITFPADKIVGRTHRIDPIRVIEQIVIGLEVSESSLEVVTYDDITSEQAADWLLRLANPLRTIRALQNRLKEIA